MALLRDAAIIHHGEDGRETVHLLNAPLRGWRPSRRQRVYQFESENGTLTSRAVGDPRWDAEVTVRFDALPTSLLNTLALGVTGTLVYLPSLSAGGPGYEMQVLYDGERLGLDPDSARWAFGEYEITLRIRRPAGETLEGLIESGPWLALYTAGAPGLTTTRSDPATYRDRSGIVRTAAPGVLRLDWQDGRPYALVEPEGENLLMHSADMTAGAWQKAGSSTAEPTSIPGPVEGTTAVRVSPDPTQTAGVRQVVLPGTPVEGQAYSSGVWLRGEGDDIGRQVSLLVRSMSSGAGGVSVDVALTAEWQRAELPVWTGGSGQNGVDLRLRTDNVATPATSVLVGNATLEAGPVLTSDIVTGAAAATRDRDRATLDYLHPPGSMAVYEAGIEAGLRDQTDAGRAWQIGSGTGVSQRALQLYRHASSDVMSARLGNGSTSVQSTAPLIPLGAEYQRLALLDIQGTEARVRLLQRYRETPGSGPWIDASGEWSDWLDVSALLAQGWESPHLTIGNVREGTRAGRLALSLLGVLRGADWSLDSATRLPQVRQVLGRGR